MENLLLKTLTCFSVFGNPFQLNSPENWLSWIHRSVIVLGNPSVPISPLNWLLHVHSVLSVRGNSFVLMISPMNRFPSISKPPGGASVN